MEKQKLYIRLAFALFFPMRKAAVELIVRIRRFAESQVEVFD